MSQWPNQQHKENSCEIQQIISGLFPKFFSESLRPLFSSLFSLPLFSVFRVLLLLLLLSSSSSSSSSTFVHMFQVSVSTTLFFALVRFLYLYLRLLFCCSYLSHFLAIKLICFFIFFLVFHWYWLFLCLFSSFSFLLLPSLLPFSLLLFSPSISFLYLLLNGATYFLKLLVAHSFDISLPFIKQQFSSFH